MTFVLLDIETCSCTDKPTLKDPVLAFGTRICSLDEGCKPETDYIYTWASDSGCSTVGECENSVLRGLLKRLEDVAREACSNEPRPRLFIVGYNIKSFDLPVISSRAIERGIINVNQGFILIRGEEGEVGNCSYKVIYLDFIDFVKALTFPQSYIRLVNVAYVLNKCLGKSMLIDLEREKPSFLRICRESNLCKESAELSTELKNMLGAEASKRLKQDLDYTSAIFEFLTKIRRDGDLLACFYKEVREIVKQQQLQSHYRKQVY
jgi:DNA polymerase elongation subunit (family B)